VQEVRDTAALGVTHRLGELRQDVMSESGVRLGQVADLEFDPPTGAVTALRFIREGATAPDEMDASVISRAQIVQLTAKMAVVQHAVLEPGAGEAEAARAATLGQVVDLSPARNGPTALTDSPNAEEQAATGRSGQEQHMQAGERVART
jgi:sporulation protein YlmC with PRC-barrel domain